MQDIQFLGIRLRLDLGVALLPESKAQEIAARACKLSSLRVLSYHQVAQLMGSLNWASGLLSLGRLHLRPLQRYFHSLGLTDRFIPPRRSDPSVLASLLQQWQDLSFLTSGIPIRPFQAYFTIFSATVFKLPPSSVHVSDSRATSTGGGCSVSGLVGDFDVHVSSISPAQQGYSETTVNTGGRSDSDIPLVAKTVMVSKPTSSLCGPLFPYRRDLLSQQDQRYVSDGKSYRLHAWRLSCDITKQQAFQTRSLGLPQHPGDPQQIACTTIGGSASPDGLQGSDLIRLTPQLLK